MIVDLIPKKEKTVFVIKLYHIVVVKKLIRKILKVIVWLKGMNVNKMEKIISINLKIQLMDQKIVDYRTNGKKLTIVLKSVFKTVVQFIMIVSQTPNLEYVSVMILRQNVVLIVNMT